jgi:SOS-response transcriptional repressor LexA
MEMNEESILAWNIIEKTSANLFLTGKAGTGKTTFLKQLKEKSPKRMVVLAPTGIAAINAGGMTIHSFFQLPFSPYIPGTTFGSGEQKRYQFSKLKRNIIRSVDLLVIDEISMVRSDLLDAIDSVLRQYRKRHDLPFGGVQLLMIGDLQQLAPVVTAQEEQLLKEHYDTPFFFSSNALKQVGYLTVELKKVYRQQDEQFISLLNQIRENRASDATLQALNQRFIPNFEPPKNSNFIRLTTHNAPAQQINEQQLAALPSRAFSYTAEVEDNFPESSYPADFMLTLKPGAQVMFIKNDPQHRFYNGMIGEVIGVKPDEEGDKIIVRSKDSDEEFELEKMEWVNAKYTINEETKEIEETVEGKFRQYPLRLAWAITIHKIRLTFHPAEFGAKMPIPLAEQSVKAGFPSPAQDYMEGEIDLNDILVRHREATFYVRVSGDSMQDAGILDGDLAIVDRQIEPSNGNFVIAFVDGEFTIKQFKMDESGAFGWLIPWNKNFSPIRVDETNRFMIWGVVTYVIHQIAE